MEVCPVLIVGGGPVGLALAADLGWRGIDSLVVDRGDGSIFQPKMDLVGIRTMEFCRRWGIVDWVESSLYPRDYPQDNVYATALTGWELGRERMPPLDEAQPPPQSPQRRERCPQDIFDPILRRLALSFQEVALDYRTQFLGYEQDQAGVTVALRDVHTGRERDVRCSFLVGCDGATSRVRQLAGIAMKGTPALTYTTNVIFVSTELPAVHRLGLAYRFILIGAEGTWATIVAINGRDRWRMSIIGDGERRVLTTEDVRAAIVRAVGTDFAFEVESVVPWTRAELVAERYDADRVFIAGDAAHVMSPTGGFGMNTGIGDAVDLSWKLAARLRGWGGPELTASYDAERRPVAERNVAEAGHNLRRMLSPRHELAPGPEFLDESEAGAAARTRLGEEFSAQMKHEWHTLGVHLGYRYDNSPIVVEDGSASLSDDRMSYEQTARPGGRAPHVWLANGRSTLDWYGRDFVLLRLGDDAPDVTGLSAAAVLADMPLRVVTCSEAPVQAAYGNKLVLVRPDGHVAWRSDEEPVDARLLIDTLRGAAPTSAGARVAALGGAA